LFDHEAERQNVIGGGGERFHRQLWTPKPNTHLGRRKVYVDLFRARPNVVFGRLGRFGRRSEWRDGGG
jgi:hypothetical protein